MAERDGMQKASNRQSPRFPLRTQVKGEVLAGHPPIVKNPHKGAIGHPRGCPSPHALDPRPDRKNRLPTFFLAVQS